MATENKNPSLQQIADWVRWGLQHDLLEAHALTDDSGKILSVSLAPKRGSEIDPGKTQKFSGGDPRRAKPL